MQDPPKQPNSQTQGKSSARSKFFAQALTASAITLVLTAGCQASDNSSLTASLDRYAELSSRQLTDSWPVEFGEVLSGDALSAAEAGFLLLADGGFSQVGSVAFNSVEILSPGVATACLDLSESLIVHESGATMGEQPSERVRLGFHRMGGAVKITSFDLAGETC